MQTRETATVIIDLTDVLVAAIALTFAIATKIVAPLIKAKIGEASWNKLCNAAWIGVKAAEQLYKTGVIKDRKRYVLDYLEEKGFEINSADVENLIEGYVQEINATQMH